MELPQQSDTRWVCKHKAVEVFKLRLDSVLKTLEYFAELVGQNGKERAEAKGLLLQLHSLVRLALLLVTLLGEMIKYGSDVLHHLSTELTFKF